MLDFVEENLPVEGSGDSAVLVAVKTLREDANKNARWERHTCPHLSILVFVYLSSST